MGGKRSWRRKSAWSGAAAAAFAGAFVWFFYAVAGPRLGSQNAIEGLAAPAGLDWQDPAHVDSLLAALADAFAERPQNAGIAIGVTRDGKRHVAYRGVTSIERPTAPVDASTLFEIGSLTKTFTGVALAQAVRRGDVTLDQPIADLLPTSIDFPEPVRSLRLGELATHTAGLPRDPPSIHLVSVLFREHPFGKLTDREAFVSLAGVDVRPAEERTFAYSNFGFMLLGRLIEEASGQSYARLIEDGLAEPLGMDHTWVDPPDAELAHLAEGHRVGRPVEHWYSLPLPGASGVVSTVPDMLSFLEAHLKPDTTALAAALRLATEPRTRASETVEMGLGWQIYTVPDAPRVVYHHGSMMGFRSYLGMAPELELGIVVLGNSRDITVSEIGRLVMRTLTGTGEAGSS